LVVSNLIVAQVKASNSLGTAVNFSPANTGGITVKSKPLAPPTIPVEGINTAYNQIEIEIDAVTGLNTGDSVILNYEIFWNQGSIVNSFVSLITLTATNNAIQTYLQTIAITAGETYQYKYRAYNVYGQSLFSGITSIVPKSPPAQITDVSLTLVSTNVVISWTAPNNRGDTITKYRVTFLDKADSLYKEVASFCGLAASSPLTTTSCTVPMENFGSTLGYSKGELLLVKVEAYNVKGYGLLSAELTSGLSFQTIPVQILNLAGSATDKQSVSLTWDPITSSPANGYSSITGYEVWWDSGTQNGSPLVFLESSGTNAIYSKSLLTTGAIYRFAVLAKNIYGSGPLSSEAAILIAGVPDQMASIATSALSTSIVLTWASPVSNNGDTITAYRIKLLNAGTGLYTEDTSL